MDGKEGRGDGEKDVWIDGSTGGCVDRLMDTWMDGPMDRSIDGRNDACIDDGCIGGCMDR